jgi:hypothetical protein
LSNPNATAGVIISGGTATVAGEVTVDNFPTVQVVSGPLTEAGLRAIIVDELSGLNETLESVVTELRVISELLNSGLNTREVLDDLRIDVTTD